MKRAWAKGVANEAIDFQGREKLFDKLVEKLEIIREGKDYSDGALASAGLSAVIYDTTGISTKFNIHNSGSINAAVRVPQLDRNHPLIANMCRMFASNEDLEAIKRFQGNKLIGTIDKGDSRVYGGLSNITCPVYLTRGILEDLSIQTKEIAAVILHELGHIFSYYERLIDLVTINYAIYTATEKMFKLESVVDRIEVLSEFDKYTGIKMPDAETVANSTDKGVVYTHMACEAVKQRRNIEGDEVYSYRGFEFSADQFAVRHGAGPYLVSAIDKINRKAWLQPSYMSWPLHITVELLKTTLKIVTAAYAFAAGKVFQVFMITLMMMVTRPMNKVYDDPRERFDRIEREMVAELKNQRLSPDRREQVLSDLNSVREISKEVTDKPKFWEAVWLYIIPVGNKNRKLMQFQQSLEQLSANDLYVAGAMFKG